MQPIPLLNRMSWSRVCRCAAFTLVSLVFAGCENGVFQDDKPKQPAAEISEQDAEETTPKPGSSTGETASTDPGDTPPSSDPQGTTGDADTAPATTDGTAGAKQGNGPATDDDEMISATGADQATIRVPIDQTQKEGTITPKGSSDGARTLSASELVSRIRSFADQYRNEIGAACDQIGVRSSGLGLTGPRLRPRAWAPAKADRSSRVLKQYRSRARPLAPSYPCERPASLLSRRGGRSCATTIVRSSLTRPFDHSITVSRTLSAIDLLSCLWQLVKARTICVASKDSPLRLRVS